MSKIKKIGKRLSQETKWMAADALRKTGLKSVSLPESGSRILLYHGICEENTEHINTKFISVDELTDQLTWLKENANIISAKQMMQGQLAENRFNIAITFDDGFANNHKYLLPLVQKLRIPVTIFVTAIRAKEMDFLWPDVLDICSLNGPESLIVEGLEFKRQGNQYVGQKGPDLKATIKKKGFGFAKKVLQMLGDYESILKEYNPDFWQMMSQEQIQEMADSPYVSIGTHGLYHNCFDSIGEDELRDELQTSKTFLEGVLGKEVELIAYPDGRYNARIIDLVEEEGYKYQFAVNYLQSSDQNDPRIMDRLGLNPFISWGNQVKAIADGHY